MRLSVKILIAIFLVSSLSVSLGRDDTEALKLIDSLKVLKERDKVRALNDLAMYYFMDKPAEAGKYATEAAILAGQIEDYEGLVHAHIFLSRIDRRNKKFDNSYKYLEQAIKYSYKSGDITLLGESFLNLGFNYYTDHNYKEAIIAFNKSADMAKKANDNEILSASLSSLGDIYNAIGEKDKALEYYSAALKIEEKLNSKPGMMNIYSCFGDLYAENSPNTAVEYYIKAYNLGKKYCSKFGFAEKAGSLSTVYLKLGNIDKALYYRLESLEIYKEINDDISLFASYMDLANIFTVSGDHHKALAYLDTATNSVLRSDLDSLSLGNLYKQYGIIYNLKKDYAKAADFYLKAYNYYQFDKKRLKKNILDLTYRMYENYNLLGNHEKSFKYFRIYAGIREEIAESENRYIASAIEARVNAEHELERLRIESNKQKAESEKLINFLISAGLIFVIALVIIYSRYRMAVALRNREKQLAEISAKQQKAYSTLSNEIKNSMFPLGYYITLTQDVPGHENLVGAYEGLREKLNKLVKELGSNKENK